ncbi:MAG: MgtC/SapB family protein [Treponema sp.]|jgi:putative Mg2+ transporter-C (MgtC) family protein|nr:MgtC/SapB family protein [Treponema sp.]
MNAITEFDVILRLALAFAAGAIIGLERSSRRQVAGLRTHILIALGSALLMLLSLWISQQSGEQGRGDPGRIAAQVVSGIGFLGAGAIIRLGNNIRGLTTAASLWLIAAVGLTLGAGMFLAAAVAEALSLTALMILGRMEKYIFPQERNKFLELSYKNSSPDTQRAQKILENFGIRVQSMDVNQGLGKGLPSKLRVLAWIPNDTNISKLAGALKKTGEVARIEIKEKF